MTNSIPRSQADRTQLQQIIAGLPEGVLIINTDQTIAWYNEATLAMHGVKSIKELGSTVSEYRERFELRYRNRHKLPPGEYPMDRLVAGEAFSEMVVEVTRPGEKSTVSSKPTRVAPRLSRSPFPRRRMSGSSTGL